MDTWLLLDANYLCWRAYYAFKGLRYGSISTEVVYGISNDLIQLQERFNTPNIAFAFDYGKSVRLDHCPGYKANRQHTSDPEKLEEIGQVRKQIRTLRHDILQSVGFNNVFFQSHYEADDIIAVLANSLGQDDTNRVIIVSSDQDLFQCLAPGVSIYNPSSHRIFTDEDFRNQFHIEPKQWVDVKAIAGCKTDNVPGIHGVGEVLASKYIAGDLAETTAAYRKIVDAEEEWKARRKIVRVPWVGTELPILRENRVTSKKWQEMADRLGMKSIRDNAPITQASIQERIARESEGAAI